MFANFKKVESINQWEKDLVIGYNNAAQKLIHPNVIPIAISYLCLVYHHEYDYFNEIWKDADIKINEKKDEFEYCSSDSISTPGTVYGLMDIDKSGYLYSWKFKIATSSTLGDDIIIGITAATNHDGPDFSIGSDNLY